MKIHAPFPHLGARIDLRFRTFQEPHLVLLEMSEESEPGVNGLINTLRKVIFSVRSPSTRIHRLEVQFAHLLGKAVVVRLWPVISVSDSKR
jgi:hypothetical protein